MNISMKYQQCNLTGTTTPSWTVCGAMSTRHRTARRNTWRRLPELFGQPWTGTSRPTSLCWGGISTLRPTSSTKPPDRGPRGRGGLRWRAPDRPWDSQGAAQHFDAWLWLSSLFPGLREENLVNQTALRNVSILLSETCQWLFKSYRLKLMCIYSANFLISRLERTWKKRKEQYVWKKDE